MVICTIDHTDGDLHIWEHLELELKSKLKSELKLSNMYAYGKLISLHYHLQTSSQFAKIIELQTDNVSRFFQLKVFLDIAYFLACCSQEGLELLNKDAFLISNINKGREFLELNFQR